MIPPVALSNKCIAVHKVQTHTQQTRPLAGPAAAGRAWALRARPWPVATPRLALHCEFSQIDYTDLYS